VTEQNRFQLLCDNLRRVLPSHVLAFMNVWAAQRAGHVTAPEAAHELGLWLQKYEAEKKRVRRLVLKTARDLEAEARGEPPSSNILLFPPR